MPDPQLFVALGFLVTAAVTVVSLAAFRFRDNLLKQSFTEAFEAGEAMAMPIVGSMVLFSMYVLLRFIPKEYFNVMISLYLSAISVFALGAFLERYMKPNIVTGLLCVAVGGVYFATGNWVANDVLAFAIGVTTLEMVPINNFATSFILLIGLFFYDIFWVFGSDVMLTVATGIDGPIKLTFPQTIFGDHGKKSLLGLGDLIVPGFFICQTLVFSRDAVKRGNFYFTVAVVAYFLSLVNTMAVMLIFKHGQPALLFIVPWLIITFSTAAIYKGDVRAAWSFDALALVTPEETSGSGEEKAVKPKNEASETEESLIGAILDATLHLFGLDKATSEKSSAASAEVAGAPTAAAAEKKNA